MPAAAMWLAMSLVLSASATTTPRSSDGPALQRRFPPETEELDYAAPLYASGGAPEQAAGQGGYHDPRLKPLQLQQLSQQQAQAQQALAQQAALYSPQLGPQLGNLGSLQHLQVRANLPSPCLARSNAPPSHALATDLARRC